MYKIYLGIRYDFTTSANKSRMEVEDNVNEEDNVNDGIDNKEKHILASFILKGDVIRHHNCRIKSETKNYPVPDCFKGAIM